MALPRAGAPMPGADGVERQIGHVVQRPGGGIDTPSFGHGACLRQVEASWTTTSGAGRAPFPVPASRITRDCRVTAELRSGGERLDGVLRLFDDPQDRQHPPTLLRSPELRARLAEMGAP